MSKKRVTVLLDKTQNKQTVAWYTGTSIDEIELNIKRMLGLEDHAQICLYDEDGDCIVLSDNIPNNTELVCKVVEHTGQTVSIDGSMRFQGVNLQGSH